MKKKNILIYRHFSISPATQSSYSIKGNQYFASQAQ